MTTLLFTSFPCQGEYAIGYLYLKNGQPEKAYKEFRELAEYGFSFYMNMIADMHLKGIGVAADPVLAHVWYSLSAAQDNEEGMRMKRQIEKTLGDKQMLQSHKLTREFARLYLEPFVAGWSLDW